MISLLPAYHETIVLPRPADVIFQKLSSATTNKPFIQANETHLIFNGWVKAERFKISLRVNRHNHYLPLVAGQIESSSSGSIMFLDYNLFPTFRVLMTLWTILLLMGGILSAYQFQNIIYLLGGIAIAVLVYAIIWSNFQLQLKPTRDALHRLIS